MRGKRLLTILCVSVLLVLGTAGCSSPNQADTDAVNAAMDKFRACTSFTVIHVTKSSETITVDDVDHIYSSSSEMELKLISGSASKMKSTTTSKTNYDGDTMEQTFISYIVPENSGYAEYITDGNEWYKVTSEYSDALSGIGADSVTETFFIDSIAFCKAGNDTIDGVNAARYEGSLGGENLVAMLEMNGQLSSISSMSENQQAKIKENLAKDLDDVTVSVWVDEASGYPVRFEVSLANVLNDMEQSIAKSLGNKSSDSQWVITEYVISMTASDFDAVGDIVPPPESASAIPYEEAVAAS